MMGKGFSILAVVILLISSGWATTPHTIAIDGANDFAGDEHMGNREGLDWYVTWDDNFVYIGANGVDLWNDNVTAAFWFHGVTGSTGQTGAVVYASGIAPSYYTAFNDSGNLWTADGLSGGWANWANQSGSWSSWASQGSAGFSEWAVPRTFLGSPANGDFWAIVLMGQNNAENWAWGTLPADNPTGGANPETMTHVFFFDSMGAGVAPNAAPSSNDPASLVPAVETWELY